MSLQIDPVYLTLPRESKKKGRTTPARENGMVIDNAVVSVAKLKPTEEEECDVASSHPNTRHVIAHEVLF